MKLLLVLILCSVQISCVGGGREVLIASTDTRLIKNTILDELGQYDRRFTVERETDTQLILSQPMIKPTFFPADAQWVLCRSNPAGPGNRASGLEWRKLNYTENHLSLKNAALGRTYSVLARSYDAWAEVQANGSNWVWFTLQPTPGGTIVRYHHEARVFYLTTTDPAPGTGRYIRFPQHVYEPSRKAQVSEPKGGMRFIGSPARSGEMERDIRIAKGWVESGKTSPFAGWRSKLLRP